MGINVISCKEYNSHFASWTYFNIGLLKFMIYASNTTAVCYVAFRSNHTKESTTQPLSLSSSIAAKLKEVINVKKCKQIFLHVIYMCSYLSDRSAYNFTYLIVCLKLQTTSHHQNCDVTSRNCDNLVSSRINRLTQYPLNDQITVSVLRWQARHACSKKKPRIPFSPANYITMF